MFYRSSLVTLLILLTIGFWWSVISFVLLIQLFSGPKITGARNTAIGISAGYTTATARAKNVTATYVDSRMTSKASTATSVSSTATALYSLAATREAFYATSILAPNENQQLSGTPAMVQSLGRIAFERKGWGAGESQILTMNADGSGEIVLSQEGRSPVWYWPDQLLQIAYYTDSSSAYLINADGSGKAIYWMTVGEGSMAVGLDGQSVAWSDNATIYFVPALPFSASKSPTTYEAKGQVTGLAWSPDGTQIAFSSGSIEESGLYILDVKQLKATPVILGLWIYEPAWSPDGSQIAFALYNNSSLNIYTIYPNGTHPVRLTDRFRINTSPTWSPDGNYIAFASNRTGDFNIFVMRADGSQPIQITFDKKDDIAPAWQPILLESQPNATLTPTLAP